MKTRASAGLAVLLVTLAATSTTAQEEKKPTIEFHDAAQAVERVPLADVMAAVRKNSKKTFLVHSRINPDVAIGQASIRDIDYALLLQILRNNDLAAATVDGVVNIVPVSIIRQYPLPMISSSESDLSDEEWVTGVLQLENTPARALIPIMRPLMPQAGHLAASPNSNSVIIVDRLGNARRIIAMMKELDQTTVTQAE